MTPVFVSIRAVDQWSRAGVAIDLIVTLFHGEAGSRPGWRVTFFCFAKRNSRKKRRPAVWVPYAALRGNLRCSTPAAVQTTRLWLKQVWPDLPPPSALLGPASTGYTGADSDSGSKSALRTCGLWLFFPFRKPLRMRRGAQGQPDQGWNLFERSELFQNPAGLRTAGCPKRSVGTQEPGSPFFSLGFFGEAKKSNSPAGARPGIRPMLCSMPVLRRSAGGFA